MVRSIVFGVLLTVGALGTGWADHAADFARVGLVALDEGTKQLDFELEDLNGAKSKLSDLKGRVVLLNFWATWCPPCREEMPSMQKLHEALSDDGLVVLAVNLREDKKTVQRFMKDNDLSFPVWLDATGYVGSVYGARSIPTTYIIDRKGFVLGGMIGGRDWSSPDVLALVGKILTEEY